MRLIKEGEAVLFLNHVKLNFILFLIFNFFHKHHSSVKINPFNVCSRQLGKIFFFTEKMLRKLKILMAIN